MQYQSAQSLCRNEPMLADLCHPLRDLELRVGRPGPVQATSDKGGRIGTGNGGGGCGVRGRRRWHLRGPGATGYRIIAASKSGSVRSDQSVVGGPELVRRPRSTGSVWDAAGQPVLPALDIPLISPTMVESCLVRHCGASRSVVRVGRSLRSLSMPVDLCGDAECTVRSGRVGCLLAFVSASECDCGPRRAGRSCEVMRS